MQAVGEKIRVRRTGNTEYTKTDLYEVEREAALTYQNLPADASQKDGRWYDGCTGAVFL